MRKSKLDSADFAEVVANSRSVSAVLHHYGLVAKGSNFATFKSRIELLGISITHFDPIDFKIRTTHRGPGAPLTDDSAIFCENSLVRPRLVKHRALSKGFLQNRCYECGAEPYWRQKPLVLELDHINGVPNDHRLVNLRILCPNCHSQTDTFRGRNIRTR